MSETNLDPGHVLRCAARELSYCHAYEPLGGAALVHTSEGEAVITLAEHLYGPMRTWRDEPDAQTTVWKLEGVKP